MNKFTEILLKKDYTKRMVEDLNKSNLDIKVIKLEELKLAKENISDIIASLDDLKRTISEEINLREKNKDKEVVNDFLSSFTSSTENARRNDSKSRLILEEVPSDTTKGAFVKKEEPQKNPRQEYMGKAMARAINEVRENIERKEEHKTEVPEKIRKAVEIARKYKVGISFLENGDVIHAIESGQMSIEEAMVPIMNMYLYLVETRTASNEDIKYIIQIVNKELNIENMLKSFIADKLISKLH